MMRFDFSICLLLFLFTADVLATPASSANPMEISISGFSNLSTAKSSPKTDKKIIVIDKEVTANDLTFTAGSTVHVIKGGLITINSGKHLRIESLEAGLYQIFSGTGTVTGLNKSRPEWFGSSDNQAEIQKAFKAVKAKAIVIFSPNTYRMNGGVVTANSVEIQGNNATLSQTGTTEYPPLLYIANAIMNGTPHPGYPGTVAAFVGNLAKGQSTINIDNSAGFALGDTIVLFLGQDPYDAGQHKIRLWRKIIAINGNTLSFDFPIDEDVSGKFINTYPGLSPTTHRLVKFTNDIDNVTVKDLNLKQTDGIAADAALLMLRMRNVTVENIRIDGVRSLAFGEMENVSVKNIVSNTQQGMDIYGVRNFQMSNVVITGVTTPALYIENQVRGANFENFTIHCSPYKAPGPLIPIYGGSTGVVLKGFTIYMPALGVPVMTLLNQDSEYRTEDFTLLGSHQGFPLSNHFGFINYKGVQYSTIKKFARTIPITENMVNADIDLPAGLYKSFKVYIKSKTGLHDTYLTPGNYTVKIGATDYIPAEGTFNDLTGGGYTSVGSSYPWNESAVKKLRINTDSSVPAGNYMKIEIESFTVNEKPQAYRGI